MKLFLSSFAIWVFALVCGGAWSAYAFSTDTETAMLAGE